jgi:hypothetical protein
LDLWCPVCTKQVCILVAAAKQQVKFMPCRYWHKCEESNLAYTATVPAAKDSFCPFASSGAEELEICDCCPTSQDNAMHLVANGKEITDSELLSNGLTCSSS